ncbi:MAG: nucleotidyltransferase domain-containing protein [Deltaproteobacteria bacterium]|nr:nucleotidyltransferase domain-containing protein [Deltaproteobacteria bacterium]
MPVPASQTETHLDRLRACAEVEGSVLHERIHGLLGRAAALLRARGASDVWLFGSMAWGGVHAASDVDLAVQGLSGAAYDEALAELPALLGAEAHLVRLETAPVTLVTLVREHGVSL